MESTAASRFYSPEDVVTLEHICLKSRNHYILRDINLSLRSGEIHALLGGKGSGKSPIGNIINGSTRADGGRILYFGADSREYGKKDLKPVIGMIHQNRTANPHFSVWEHLYHDNRSVYRGVLLSRRKLMQRAASVLRDYGLELDVHMKIEELAEPDYLILELIRHSLRNPDVLIIDEAFSQLSHPHIDIFTRIITGHKTEGVAILFITHNIELLYDFADRITILQNGKNLFTGLTGSIDKINMIRLTYTDNTRRNSEDSEEENFHSFLRYNKAILEDLPVSLLVLDGNNTVIMANEYFERQMQLGPREYRNRHIRSFFNWQSERIMKALGESLKNRKLKTLYNVPIQIRETQTINTMKILPIHDGLRALGQIILIEDVTDYFKFQKKMMLSGNMESIGILAAGVAHEINNSLEVAFNYIRYLSQNFNSPHAAEPFSELRQEMVTIKQVVSKLANFSETNLPQVRSTDLNTLVGNFVRLIENTMEEDKVLIHCLLSDEPVMTLINPNEFREILTNLVKNSREVLPSGGNIRIRTKLRSGESGVKAVLSVEDDGPGIATDMMETVFLPFYSTKKKDSENVGLGLSLCYSIVDRCGGTIYAENIKPRGCRFTIELPVESDS
jgi:signal transduction histidine kinase/ABC-type multidrug transport system ATPase subunit